MQLQNYFAQDKSGNALPGATVYVLLAGTATLATGLQDRDGAALTNPFNADTTGLIELRAPNGDYDLRVTFTGGLDYRIRVQFEDAKQFREDVESSSDTAKGATKVGYRLRSAHIKLDAIISSMDTGAVGNGVANDSAALASAKALAGTQAPFLLSKVHAAVSSINLDATFTLGAPGAGVASSNATAGIALSGDFTRIFGGTYSSNAGPVIASTAASVQGVDIFAADITNTSAVNSHGINISTSTAENFKVAFTDIQAQSFGVLTNTPGTNIDSLIFCFNKVRSELADAFEFNAPLVTHKNILTVGNIAAAGAAGSNPNSGFTFGAAAAKNLILLGNISTESRQEAVHIEDDQARNLVVANVLDECGENAVRILQGGVGAAMDADGVVVVGNAAKGKAGNIDSAYRMVWDAFDSAKGCTFVGNRATNFAIGLQPGNTDVFYSANVVEDCSIAVSVDGRGRVHGKNLSVNCPTLVKTTLGTVVDKQASATAVTTVLDTSNHAANTIGTILKGFQFPTANASLGASGTLVHPLFATPLRMFGRLRCVVRSTTVATDHSMVSADVLWDGVTLTVSNIIRRSNGSFGASPTFTEAGGNINLSVFVGAAVTAAVYVDFDGDYYK